MSIISRGFRGRREEASSELAELEKSKARSAEALALGAILAIVDDRIDAATSAAMAAVSGVAALVPPPIPQPPPSLSNVAMPGVNDAIEETSGASLVGDPCCSCGPNPGAC